ALANSLDALTDPTTPATWIPIGTDGAGSVGNGGDGFSGTFNGLGNTISNLTVNLGLSNYVGLFGYVGAGGAVKNIGLVSDSVTGDLYVGALAGYNDGTLSNAYATGTVGGFNFAGGLVGLNDAAGNIGIAFATGAVSGNQAIGGLVGHNNGTISNAYAVASVSGNVQEGGLVGNNNNGSISSAYAAGGLTTTQLQAALPSGFDSKWAIISNISYPYLTGIYATAPQIVSGTVNGNTGGTAVTGIANGAGFGTATTGANGYYYFQLAPGTLGSSEKILTYVSGSSDGNAVSALATVTSSDTTTSLAA